MTSLLYKAGPYGLATVAAWTCWTTSWRYAAAYRLAPPGWPWWQQHRVLYRASVDVEAPILDLRREPWFRLAALGIERARFEIAPGFPVPIDSPLRHREHAERVAAAFRWACWLECDAEVWLPLHDVDVVPQVLDEDAVAALARVPW